MKKLLLTILTFLYLMLSTGFSIELHYCMGKFTGVDFHSSQNEKCRRCGMTEKKGGCCNDEVKFFKLNDSFKNTHSSYSSFECKAITSVNKIQIPAAPFNFITILTTPIPVKSESFGPPIFIRNRVIQI